MARYDLAFSSTDHCEEIVIEFAAILLPGGRVCAKGEPVHTGRRTSR